MCVAEASQKNDLKFSSKVVRSEKGDALKNKLIAIVLLSGTIAFLAFTDPAEPTFVLFDDSVVVMLGLVSYLLYESCARAGFFTWLPVGSLPSKAQRKQDGKVFAPLSVKSSDANCCPKSSDANCCSKSSDANWRSAKVPQPKAQLTKSKPRQDTVNLHSAKEEAIAGHASTDASTYNKLIDGFVKQDDMTAAEALLKKMSLDGVKANELSYATLIQGWARRGDLARAGALVDTMVEVGLEPNAVCFNAIISACSHTGDISGATSWCSRMRSRGILPTMTTYSTMVDAKLKSGDIEGAERWMESMEASGLQPKAVTYSSMVDACIKGGDPKRAHQWHLRMQAKGFKPSAYSFSVLMNGFAKAGNVDGATGLLSEMARLGVKPNIVIYSGLLHACSTARKVNLAQRVFQQLKADGLEPNIVAYASLALTFANAGLWREVEALSDELTQYSLTMNSHFLFALLLSYSKGRPRQADRAEAAFRKAMAAGIEINQHLRSVLIAALGRSRCQQVLQDLKLDRKADRP